MRTASVVGLLAALVACNMIFSSCRGPQGVQPAPNFSSFADYSVQVVVVGPRIGTAPMTVRYYVGVEPYYRGAKGTEFGDKIEVRFGDDYEDVTEKALRYLKDGRKDGDLLVKVFTEPGSYSAYSWVTFWDGTDKFQDPENYVLITVLPPEGGGGSG